MLNPPPINALLKTYSVNTSCRYTAESNASSLNTPYTNGSPNSSYSNYMKYAYIDKEVRKYQSRKSIRRKKPKEYHRISNKTYFD